MSDTGEAGAVESKGTAVERDAVEREVEDPEVTDREAESEKRDDEPEVDTSHLDDVDDGCGCAEVWEHLSEERDD